MSSSNYDIGLANDGDADRITAMGPDGRFINGQKMLCLLLLHMIEDRNLKGAIVRSIQTTQTLDRIAKKYNLKIYERQVGFKHVARLMRTKDILIGGEESGGIGYKGYIPERDGILGGLLLLEMLAKRKKSIIDIIEKMEEEFGRFFYKREDIRLTLNERDKIFKRLSNSIKGNSFGKPIKTIKRLGGLKLIFKDDSWIFFRPSGTESILRICAESFSEKAVSKLVEKAKVFLLKNKHEQRAH
ncbi:MAG: phosphoglucomutase/phosphomannomutase family protein, partial [Candidatus Omnitrophica bacterium]|nr:phosphoglucomutase/phosphomannomutase family protein [Candidatus Omnitrophota bacterium]